MKKYLFAFALVIVASFAFAQEESGTPASNAQVTFTEKSFDFGDIKQGDVVTHVFKFENTGTEPLILSDVRTTCGCTAPEWPKEPILPGKKSEIKVVFNSSGKVGSQNKVITVISNAKNSPERVSIVTNVNKEEEK